jgi:hypothetical protein
MKLEIRLSPESGDETGAPLFILRVLACLVARETQALQTV